MPAPSVISGRVYYSAGYASSRTVSSVNATGGSLLLIKVSPFYSDGSKIPTSVTFNGVSVGAAHAQAGSAQAVALLYFVNAPTQTTANVVATWDAGTHAVVIVEVWQDTHATTPLKAAATANATSGTDATVTCTTGAVGDTITDVLCVGKALTGTSTASVGSGQTQTENQTSNATSTLAAIGAGSYEAGGASVVMNWTISESNRWAIVACPIAATAGGRRERITRGLHRGLSGVGV